MPKKKIKTGYWCVRGGEKGEKEQDAIKQGKIFIRWPEAGKLSKFNNREEILDHLIELGIRYKKNHPTFINYFVNTIKPGDLVIMPFKKPDTVAIGKVSGDYSYDPGSDEQFPNSRPVKWIEKTIQLPPQITLQRPTVSRVKNKDVLDFMRGVVEQSNKPYQQENNYFIENLTTDCFLDRAKLEKILDRLQTKKNLILQGPPGTGKTWLAKRLAFALVGRKDNSKVKALQFHPNLSYEDFVRGWRPAGDGKLELVDGPFLQIAEAARKDPTEKYVIVIEEINRGHPAQILGELLTLLEADKRNADEALELCYSKEDGERFFIPENLYVIGTMNIADRSLALVDLALRRRFAFVDLEPVFGEPWKKWVHDKFDIDRKTLSEIETRIRSLNDRIAEDRELGPQFRIGHSFVTPTNGTSIKDAHDWFQQVVNTEIGPTLDVYWFDNLDNARKAKEALLKGF